MQKTIQALASSFLQEYVKVPIIQASSYSRLKKPMRFRDQIAQTTNATIRMDCCFIQDISKQGVDVLQLWHRSVKDTYKLSS